MSSHDLNQRLRSVHLVQARCNGWDLAGHEGNRRAPINRETYRVLATRDDGGLEVAPVARRGPDGELLGDRMVLPAAYVGEHLALGYASTVHAAQGVTVDTTHSVITPRTGPAALYVGMSRGRESNTAHVTTITGVDDPAQGRDDHTLHRDPVATLAAVLDTTDYAAPRSAVATATESAHDAGTVRTAAELLADAAQLAATERTATWLDQLTHGGTITEQQRARIAAEDGAASLTRILRRAELAGVDPRQVLDEAVADRPLDGSRNLTNVIYSRIRDEHRFDPVGQSWADWIPRTDNPEWNDYLASLADAADRRALELGEQAADEQPAWAVDTFGAAPTNPIEREEWQDKVGIVAAYRELRGHDDAAEALGPAPQPGQVEAYAAYRAAWRVMGRPEVDREELELSDGQLRMRVRAYERELTWAPRYVANELAGTHQAAATQRQNAALRAAEAEAASDPAERLRRQTESAQAAALADTLDARAAELQMLDDARARWLLHTAGTRAAAERSKAELAARHADDAEPEQRVTADEWLAAHRDAVDEDDRYRDITAEDVVERPDDDAIDHENTRRHDDEHADARPETAVPDVREVASAEPRQVREDVVRVPSATETSESIERADRTIAEVRAREVVDEREAAEHRADELNRWHAEDQAAEYEAVDDVVAGWEPATFDDARS